MYKRLLALGMLWSMVYPPAYAQAPGEARTGTTATGTLPTANAQGMIANSYDVDCYTGTANVNIPIFDYSLKGLNLGVSLSYSTKGVKVDQSASSAGLGWILNTPGMITREVRGVEDEIMINKTGDMYHTTTDYPKTAGIWHGQNVPDAINDKEADLFTATFAGRTIQFTIAYNGIIVETKTYPDKKVTIETGDENPVSNTYPGEYADKVIRYFKITDEYGTQFTFTRGDYEEKTTPEIGNKTYTYYPITTWNLTKVVTREGTTVKMYYEHMDVDYVLYKSQKVTEIYSPLIWSTGTIQVGVRFDENKDIRYKGSFSYISKIEYAEGTWIDFIYDAAAYKRTSPVLDRIVVNKSLGNNLKNKLTYKFNHSYFQSPRDIYTATEVPYSDSDQLRAYYGSFADKEVQLEYGLRLKLNSITRIGNDNTTTEPYFTFDYNPLQLPKKFSPSRDFYGYYNGKMPVYQNMNVFGDMDFLDVSKELFIPQRIFVLNGANMYKYGTDRTPDVTKMQACILTAYTNGAGAKVSLSYKDHDLYNPTYGYKGISALTPAFVLPPPFEGDEANDGLCIDKISIYDGFNVDNNIAYKYLFADGQRFFRGARHSFVVKWGSIDPVASAFTNNPVSPVKLFNGSNHGYSYATIQSLGKGDELLGSVQYHFTNLLLEDTTKSNLEYSLDMDKKDHPIYEMYQSRMGKLIDETRYDHTGNPISKTEYLYADSISRASEYRSHLNAAGDTYWDFKAVPYRVSNKKDYTYTNSGTIVKEVNYAFNSHGDVYYSKWVDENGDNWYKEMTYLYSGGFIGGPPPLSDRVTEDLHKGTWPNRNFIDSRRRITSGYPKFYDLGEYRLTNSSPTNTPEFLEAERVEKIDGFGNPRRVKYAEREDYVSNIYDNRIGKPVATIKNAKFEDVAYTSFEGDFASGYTADDNKGNWSFKNENTHYVTPGITNQPVTGHYYYDLTDQSGIESVNVLRQGQTYIVSVWASAPPTLLTSAINTGFVQQQQVVGFKFYTATIEGNDQKIGIVTNGSTIAIDELRLHPYTASMVTSAYEPMFGPNSVCDDRGNVIYTEYDAMGRQTVTRDLNRKILSVTKHVVAGSDTY